MNSKRRKPIDCKKGGVFKKKSPQELLSKSERYLA